MLRIAVAGGACLCLLLPRLSRGGSSLVPPRPGAAILTRPGSSHGLRQVGPDDLVIIIAYQQSSGARGR